MSEAQFLDDSALSNDWMLALGDLDDELQKREMERARKNAH